MKAILVLLLTACGQVEISLPTHFVQVEDKYREQAIVAMEALNADGVLYRWEGEPGPGETVIKIVAVDPAVFGPRGGTAYNDAGVIYINWNVKPSWYHLPITIVHELGHTRGLYHSPDRNNVMYESSQNVDDVVVASQQVREAISR